jgi:hypothetical protein
MSKASVIAVTIALGLLGLDSHGFAADELTARLDSSGLIHLLRGEVELAQLDLNAHGPQWKHAPQSTATGQVTALPEGGMRCLGTLPVPNTDGAVRFAESVKPLANGLQLSYDVTVTKTTKLNGLQFSVELPVAVYGGKEVLVAQPEGEPWGVPLPAEEPKQGGGLWNGEAARLDVAADTPDAIRLELRAAADGMVQDLRTWQRDVYEIRFPAFTEDAGRDLTTDDRFHLEVTITCAGPVKLVGPAQG